jgi:hypothetical protein
VLSQKYPDDLTIPDGWAAQMAAVASEVLYVRSRRQFTGTCGPVTIRPLARPPDSDSRYGGRGIPAGYLTAGQYGSVWGVGGTGAVQYYGTVNPPTIDLGAYPVQEVTEVIINGVVIPPDEYQLQDYRQLVRVRTSASAEPTEMWGWPIFQVLDLPLTEVGTFGVTYTYGVAPPVSGFNAACALGKQLVLNALGEDNCLPQRVTRVSRQGVSVDVTDVQDFLAKGRVGIFEIDLFLDTYNPTGQRMKSLVWSPDLGRPRRMPS